MIGVHNLSIRRPLVERLELVVTVFWLLYFMDANISPPILASIINALSYPFAMLALVLHWQKIAYVGTRNIPLLVFVSLAIFSLVWSADFSSTLSISRGLIRAFIFGAYFAARYSFREQIKILTWVLSIAAVLSLATCLVIPGYGIGANGWHGIFPYKNYMGRSMVLGAILFLIIALNKYQGKKSCLGWIGFALTVILAIFAKSSTSLLLLPILLSQMPLYQAIKQQYRLRVVILSLVCILVGALTLLIVANQETILVDILGEGTTFNGRIPIWNLIIEKVSEERPWLGYGYGAFWSSDAGVYVILNTWASDQEILSTFNAHSGYIELFANLGFLGVLIYGIVVVSVFVKTITLLLFSKKVEFFWLFQFQVFIFLVSLADVSSDLGSTGTYGVLCIATCLSISLEYERFRKARVFP